MAQGQAEIGAPHIRREDRVLVAGRGTFTDDVPLAAPLHIAFVRNQLASGRLVGLDLDAARHAEGVVAAFGAGDLGVLGDLSINEALPLSHRPAYPVLAAGDLLGVGQPVAAVLAEGHWQALDAAELVLAEIEDTPAASQVIAETSWTDGDAEAAFATAAHVVECTVRHPRLAPSPMEPRAIAIAYDAETDHATIWHSTQTPHRSRADFAAILGIDPARIRVIATHVGGAFGMKASVYPEEVFAVWAAFRLRRDVKWTATRSEEFLSATHGRGVTSHGRLALDAEGRFLALIAEAQTPVGPWIPNSGLITAWNAGRILPTGYRVDTLSVTTRAVRVPAGPTGIYRGAGRPEANVLMERLIDKAARATGTDPLELRRRNLLTQADLPHRTATGNTLDSGDYARALDLLCEHAGYAALIAERDRRRQSGELVGIGIGFYVEPSGSGWESARVSLEADGSVIVASGSSSQGHGRETAYAQIVANALDVSMQRVEVRLADTERTPAGIGALASRSTAIGGSAVLVACDRLQARRAAGENGPLTEDVVYESKGQAWGYGAYLAMLSIDRATGTPTVERAVCADDTGRIVNPLLVEGQILGGFAQGLGEALMENVVYDTEGQLLTGSFMDYAMPRAADIPPLAITKFQTPSPMNALGAKGVGEAGTIGAPAAILNAAIDALAPLGVADLTMPLTSQALWRAITDCEQDCEQGSGT